MHGAGHVCEFENVHCCVLTNIAALNSQSSPGLGPGSPAAVGSLRAASPALSLPLYPAGPSLQAAGPRRTSSPLLDLGPDMQQTRLVLTRRHQLTCTCACAHFYSCTHKLMAVTHFKHLKSDQNHIVSLGKSFQSIQDCHHSVLRMKR